MRIAARLICLIMLVCFWTTGFAQSEYRNHMLVKVLPDSPVQLKELFRISGLDLVPGEIPGEPYLVAYPEHLTILEENGYAYEIIHENLERFYADRLGNRRLDDMGGYHTLSEIQNELAQMHDNYPSITTDTFSIGQTLEGRPVYALKISDNPEVDESEPEVYYNSLIHAREPAAMEAVLYFMNHLLENYPADPEVQYLVDNREMYFVPCVNPDGYLYNETTNPNGGGMWRKNRRNNGDGTWGVDLNRNYDSAWGIDNDGSSPYTSSETYRGTAPFSEPETQVQRDFINSRQFVTEIDYHTYSNLILYPWGTSYYDDDGLTEDNDIFEMIADSMAYFIHSVNSVWYQTGTPWQTLYNTNGGSFDWEYEEQTAKPKIYAVTTEVGGSTDGFWPSESRILPLAQENLPANLFMARIAGELAPQPYDVNYAGQCEEEWNGDADGIIEPDEGFELTVDLKNVGMENLVNLHGQLFTTDPNASVVLSGADWPTLTANQTGANTTPFQVTVLSSAPQTFLLPMSLELTSDGGLDTTVPLTCYIGIISLADDVESGIGGWTSGGAVDLWHISSRRSDSPTHSWYCGYDGTGQYDNDMNCCLLSDTLILPAGAHLEFDHWYELEDSWDYGYVNVNTGSGWTALGSPLTGSSGGWIHEDFDLGITCDGQFTQIRFRMTSDDNTPAEGWYIDNVCAGPGPEFILSNPDVSPDFGESTTTFTYSITYTNAADEAPQSAEVYIDNSLHALSTLDFTYSDGSVYMYETTLGGGVHEYYFLFSGASSQVRVPLSGAYSGPLVGSEIICYDFESDQGWTAGAPGDDATIGLWERADPEGTWSGSNPVQPEDDHSDPGVSCWVTGPLAGSDNWAYDVDGGRTTLLSPLWDLTDYSEVLVDLWTWYSNDAGNNPGQDDFIIDVSDDGGSNWINLLTDRSDWEYWRNSQFLLGSYINLTDQVQVRIIADDVTPGSVVEAAVDDFCLFGAASAPESPTELTIQSQNQDIILVWRHSEGGAVSYRIEQATVSDGLFELLDTVSGSDSTYTHTGGAVESRLFYRVIAEN